MRNFAQRATLVLGLSIAATVGALPAWADFDAGVAAYGKGDFATAAKEWRASAEASDLAAMRNLGHLYRWGKGVPQDLAQARAWYQRASTMGLDRAMLNLAVMLLNGEGGPADAPAAAHWLGQAAATGNPDAMVRLADLLEGGVGVSRDPVEARRLLTRAAALGNTEAAARLSGAPTAAPATKAEDGPETGTGAIPTKTPAPAPDAEPEPKATLEPMPKATPDPAPEASDKTETRAASADPAKAEPTESRSVPAATGDGPKLPPVRGAETVDGTMLHLGAYPSKARAETAWREVIAAVPTLAEAEPFLLSGYVPGTGDIVRLYARPTTEAALKRLCADLQKAGRACEPHRFFK